jgi:hypothetical protein
MLGDMWTNFTTAPNVKIDDKALTVSQAVTDGRTDWQADRLAWRK